MNFIFSEEICGFEFDWFAIDKNEQVALFSTAGSGMIPSCIQNNIEEYQEIKIPSAKPSAKNNPWIPLAKAGIYVFDMVNSDTFDKQIDAQNKTRDDIFQQIKKLPNLLVFNGDFSKIDKIDNLENFSFLSPPQTNLKVKNK